MMSAPDSFLIGTGLEPHTSVTGLAAHAWLPSGLVSAPTGNLQRHKTLTVMDYEAREKRLPTKEEREAKKAQARKDAEKELAARKKEEDAFRANFERLKAERLAREAKS